jgi:ketosteroid isomerase-like protein
VTVAVIVAAVALAGAGVFAYKYLAGGSDEDQIKALVARFTTDFNNADGSAIASLTCSEGNKIPAGAGAFVVGYTSEKLRDYLDEYGTISTSVANVHVTGDRATAQVTTVGSRAPGQPNVETDSFAKENGSWKVCGAAG